MDKSALTPKEMEVLAQASSGPKAETRTMSHVVKRDIEAKEDASMISKVEMKMELESLSMVASALEPLNTKARHRVLRWAVDKFLPADWRNLDY